MMSRIRNLSVYGAISLSAALLLSGCTGGAETPVGSSDAASGGYESVWLELGETPGDWLDVTKTSDSLSDKQSSKFVTNFAGNCSYYLDFEKMAPTPESGSDKTKKYLNQISTDGVLGSYDVKTDSEVLPVSSVTYEDEKDYDGDGKKGKSTTLYHIFDDLDPNAYDSTVRLTYSCYDKKDWKESDLNALLDVTKIHMKEA